MSVLTPFIASRSVFTMVKGVVEPASITRAHVSRGTGSARNQKTHLSTADACWILLGYGAFSTQLASPGDRCSFVMI